ncbi:MAG: sigma-70 family RNA polymerase sigma factor [Clostridia bacterium]|nr:sigma-70 family RNA polymerase sigma factor [Clostridia bacterium]MBQ9781507.1 sigma-70 family RNA polymerase sigma factor [Clostridia bacterium]
MTDYEALNIPDLTIANTDTPHPEERRFSKNISLISLAQSGDEAAMERLVVENMGLVRSVAVKFRDRGTELEDLIQIGTIGMIKAIRSFDCDRGTAFSTYAVPLIVGEIRRHLRDDGLIRVSRGYRHLGMLLMRERTRIATEEGRDATIGELAEACGVTREEAATALDALSPVSSLSDNAFGEDSPELGAVIPDQSEADDMARRIDAIALNQVISALPPDWKKIVLLRYYRNMTQQQVADLMGLTQVKVSREEKKIMAFMRERLGG